MKFNLKPFCSVIILSISFYLAEAQSFYNRNIPNEAHAKMGDWYTDPIAVFSMTPSGGWVIVTAKGRYFARDIPQECYDKLKEFRSKGYKIEHIAFPPKGGNSWIIIADKATFSRNIPNECYTKVNQYTQSGKKIKLVVFPKKRTTDNTWLVLTEDGDFSAKNIDDECYQVMQNLSQKPFPGKSAPRTIHHVAFEPNGGWLVIADDYHFARNINNECFDRMNTFRSQKKKIEIVEFTPDGKGWSVISAENFSKAPNDPIRNFENSVGSNGIWSRMRDIEAPGVSVAVVMNGQLVWSTAYGHIKMNDSRYAVHPETMFQAASVSKVFAAVGAFKLIETNSKLTLDADLQDNLLKSSIPVNRCFNKYTDKKSVTIRNILNHNSGIMGNGTGLNTNCIVEDVGGYDGYSHTISYGSLPTLSQIIAGSSSANSPRISITYNPSARTGRSYSGPAFTILQKLTEDLTGKSYPSWMKTNVLDPMGMNKSKFVVNPENIYSVNELTWGYSNKNVRNRYPEYAAAGLWTNATELANLLIMLNGSGRVNGKTVFSSNNANQLRGGTGVNTSDSKISGNKNGYYCHGGSNAGYRAFVIGFPTLAGNPNSISNSGIVVMTNVHNTDFRYEIVNEIIKAYGW
jgi:CubicO group peptidase (beta-lactamase class C family)